MSFSSPEQPDHIKPRPGKRDRVASPACAGIAGFAALLLVSGVISARAVRPEHGKAATGEQIYRRQCAACHGAKGAGTKSYEKRLAGSRTTEELAAYISASMPPGPRHASASDARKAAVYIHDTFYSAIARARSAPARIALSRLTVRQFRSCVSDLIGSFHSEPAIDARRGLNAEYFKARRFQQDERVVQRIDPQVRFDFGTSGPVPDKFDPHQFSIRWQGGILAPDSGEYEFIVRTEHSMRLWVDDTRTPLIDAWVKSGSDTTFRGSVYLLAGRVYPVRLEFSKSTQGVDDTDKQKNKPAAKASIAFLWKRPKLAEEVVPQRCLLPEEFAPAFVPSTPFPPDDRSIGYERGTSVSKSWDEATTSAALETADYVTSHLRDFAGVPDQAPDREVKVRAFCRQFVERAFRRPHSPDVEQLYLTRQFKSAPDLNAAVKRVVLLTLKSPRFLYRELDSGKPDAYDMAARLSFGLWDSLPDVELIKAAADGQLSTPEQVAKQADRMAGDTRTWIKLRDFLLQWLKVDQYPDLGKDPKLFPGFDESAATDLRTSLELFLEQMVWNDRSDYRELMLSDKMMLNGRLSKIYGGGMPEDAPFQLVSLNDHERCGVLTQPYLMASFAYVDNSSPIHRGVLLARNVFGRVLQPPPAAFAPLAASLHPDLTTRERVSLQTKPAACSGCHGLINPLGFTLERYDAIGRLRDNENGKPVDCTGSYQPKAGSAVHFVGARDLAEYVVKSPEAHAAFVEKLFQHVVKQPVRAYGPQTLPDLQTWFETHDYNIRRLMVQIATDAALKR